MKTYNCYFIDRNLRPLKSENLECDDDRTAVQAAASLLKHRSCAGIEVWDRGRYVAQLLRKPSAEGSHVSS